MKSRSYRRQLRRRKYQIQKLAPGPDDAIIAHYNKAPRSPKEIMHLLKAIGDMFPRSNNKIMVTIGVQLMVGARAGSVPIAD